MAKIYDSLFELIIVGDANVGKTDLMDRFVDDAYGEFAMPTFGANLKVRIVEWEGKKIKLQMWDTLGRKVFRDMVTPYFRGVHGIMVVYNITYERSFHSVRDWMRLIEMNASSDVEVMVIGNKCHLEGSRVISQERGRVLAEEYGVKFMEVSAKSGLNVKAAFLGLTKSIKNKIEKRELSKSHAKSLESKVDPRTIILSDDPLWSAIYSSKEDSVLAALREGADINSDDYLHVACVYNHIRIATLLLKYGADVARVNYLDQTAPYDAYFNNSMECAELLLKHDCSPCPDKFENKGGDLARSRELAEFVERCKPQPRDPLTTFPSLKQLRELPEVQHWHSLGVQLRLSKEELEGLKKTENPTIEMLCAAKNKNIDLQWKEIVWGLLTIGEHSLAESVYRKQGSHNLPMCVIHGWLNSLKYLLDTVGLDPKDAVNNAGDTPILLACGNGHLEMAKYLVESHGCAPNDTANNAGDTPILLVCSNGDLEMAKYLVEVHGCAPNDTANKAGDTPILLACANGHLETAKYLFEVHGCAPNDTANEAGDTPILLACANGHLEMAKYLFEVHGCAPNDTANEAGDIPILLACANGHLEMAKYLVEIHGCAPNGAKNKAGDTLISLAYKNSHLKTVKYLSEELQCDPKVAVNKAGDTPLSLECSRGDLEMVKALINGHVDPNKPVNKAGDSLISLACKGEHWKVVKYLANAYHCHHHYDTKESLLLAAKTNQLIAVETLLVDCHADPNVMDEKGRSPIVLTTDTEIMKLLLKHGAMVEDVYRVHSKIIGKLSSQQPLNNPLIILIIGDGGAGKSTLLKSLLNPRGLAAYFTRAKPVTGVDEKTVGIIPYEVETKEFGKASIYDFAGQREFFSSHCAVVENAVQTSPPAILYCANLLASDEEIEDSTNWWMTLIKNHCTNLEGKAHVIVIGSHADEVKKAQGDPWSKESIFAPIIGKFPSLEFVSFLPMDCRFADCDEIKQARKLIQSSAAVLRSPETVSLNAHTFYIYLLDSFKQDLAIQLKDIHQQIHSDLDQAQTKKMKDILSFIPTTLQRLIEICDQLSRKGLILLLRNESTPENSFIVCDRTTLLSKVTGTVFAPENFKQHCRLASSTGVVPLIKFCLQFKSLNAEMLISFMTRLELCYEIKDKELLDGIAELFGEANQTEVDPDGRYLFFPGLIRMEMPEQAWIEKPAMSYHFGWVLQTVQSHQFFDPRSFQVTILRIAISFRLSPASTLKSSLPSLQQRCSVWKNGICWGNEYGFIHLELLNNGKCLVVKIRSRVLEPELLLARHKVLTKVLKTASDFCPNIETTESVIAPEQVVKHPLRPVDNLTLCTVSDIAKAVLSKAANVESLHDPQPLKELLKFEPYIGLDQDILQYIHSDKNAIKDEKISNEFINHFAAQATNPDRTVSQDPRLYSKMLICPQAANAQQGDPKQKLVQALDMWRRETDGTYSCLRETLNKYSIFSGRNPLDLAGVVHEEIHSSILSTAATDTESKPDEEMDKFLTQYQLTKDDPCLTMMLPDDNQPFLDISKEIDNWVQVARALGLKKPEITGIKADNPLHESNRKFEALRRWWSNGLSNNTATYLELIKALVRCEETPAAICVCKIAAKEPRN